MDKINIAEPIIGKEEINAVTEVIKSKNLACGKIVSQFEREFAERMNVKYAVAVTSGTAALCLALQAFGIHKGNVITSPFSFFASASCIFYNGAVPWFVDIKESDFNIDEDKIEKELSYKTKAILPVSLFGKFPDTEKIRSIAKRYEIPVIYDNCQAHAAYDGVSRFHGDACCYSLYPTKNMTTGEGGVICTNNVEAYKKLMQLRNHGMSQKYVHDIIAYNYRMTDLNAAIGLCQLKKLGINNLRRRKNVDFYNYLLEDLPIIIPEIVDGHVFNQYTIRTSKREEIIKKFDENNIGYGIYYPSLITEQPALEPYISCGAINNYSLPVAQQMTKEVLSLPVHPKIDKDEIKFICSKIKECF